MEEIAELLAEMNFRGFSLEVQKTYGAIFNGIVKYLEKPIAELDKDEINGYIVYLKEKGHSPESLNRVISAIRFAKKYFDAKKKVIVKNTPVKESSGPIILSKEEIKHLIGGITNPKHRIILKTLYGLGLRVSEVQNLTTEDLDFDNNKAIVCGLGKCREIPIPESLSKELSAFIQLNGTEQIFPGRDGQIINVKTIQKAFEKALLNSGINKKVSCNTLRHSFAVHLLENGTDIKVVQKLLGHTKLETTKIYTKVYDFDVSNIQSPLDTL